MASKLGSGGARYRGSNVTGPVDTAWLGVFQRSALTEIGGYDERFVRNQDAELNLRLRRAGYEVWLDRRLIVDYQPRSTLQALGRQYWKYGWWRMQTGRKHRKLALRQLAVPLAVLVLASSVAASFWMPWLLVLPLGYVAALVAQTFVSKRDLDHRERAMMVGALVTMHFSWAVGFLTSASISVLRRNRRDG